MSSSKAGRAEAQRDFRVRVARLKMGILRRVDPEHHAAHQHTGPRPHEAPVRTRLQALFSQSSSPPASPAPNGHIPLSPVMSAPPIITLDPPDLPVVPTPRFLKVRVVTWNMHESLPKARELLHIRTSLNCRMIAGRPERAARPRRHVRAPARKHGRPHTHTGPHSRARSPVPHRRRVRCILLCTRPCR